MIQRGRIAVTIHRARLAAGLTQQQLADRLGVPAQRISEWERGQHVPAADTYLQILRICRLRNAD